jgi:tRNA(adenine34) deaminase
MTSNDSERESMHVEHNPEAHFMDAAIQEALKARALGDYAIGAVVVDKGQILAASGNRVKLDYDPTQHAEIAAIRIACRVKGTRHLEGAVLYTTAEPCPMCTSAAIWARMLGIVSGSTIADMADFRQLNGNSNWTWRTVEIASRVIIERGDPKLFLIDGYMREKCQGLFHDA